VADCQHDLILLDILIAFGMAEFDAVQAARESVHFVEFLNGFFLFVEFVEVHTAIEAAGCNQITALYEGS